MDRYRVDAVWDGEAAVWVAESDDLPGLVTEAGTLDGLFEKLKVMVPEYLDARGVADPAPWFDLRAVHSLAAE